MSVVTPTPVSASTSRRVIASQLEDVQTPPAAALRHALLTLPPVTPATAASASNAPNSEVLTALNNSEVHSPPRSTGSGSGSGGVLSGVPSSPIRPIDERGFEQLQMDFQKLKVAVHDQSQRSRAAGDLHKLLNRVTALMNSYPPLYPVYLEVDLYQLQCRISESIEALNHSEKNEEMKRLWEKSYQFEKGQNAMKQQEKDKEEMTKKLAHAHRIALVLIRNRIREKQKQKDKRAQKKNARKQSKRTNKRKHIDSDDDDDEEEQDEQQTQEDEHNTHNNTIQDDTDQDEMDIEQHQPVQKESQGAKNTAKNDSGKAEEELEESAIIEDIVSDDSEEKKTSGAKRPLKRLRKADRVSTESELFTPTRPVNKAKSKEKFSSKSDSKDSAAKAPPPAPAPSPTPRTPTKEEQSAPAAAVAPSPQPHITAPAQRKAAPLPFYLPGSEVAADSSSSGRRRTRGNASQLDPFQF